MEVVSRRECLADVGAPEGERREELLPDEEVDDTSATQ